jgi:hypothetical protein
MTNSAIEVQAEFPLVENTTQDGFLASMREIWTRTKVVEVKDRLLDTVLFPFVERYRIKTLMIIATLLGLVGCCEWYCRPFLY